MDEERKTTQGAESIFMKLRSVNVNEHCEKKKSEEGGNKELTYLSWAWAWDYFKQNYPDAKYIIRKNENGLPYWFDPDTGYIVMTEITAGGETYEMWLPVMDAKNKAMKNLPYQYTTKYNGPKTVNAATMTDINKTIMRCLVKNMAMFGLGLYIYAGEDLPEDEDDDNIPKKENKPERKTTTSPKPQQAKPQTQAQPVPDAPADKEGCVAALKKMGADIEKVLLAYKFRSVDEMPLEKLQEAYRRKKAALKGGK